MVARGSGGGEEEYVSNDAPVGKTEIVVEDGEEEENGGGGGESEAVFVKVNGVSKLLSEVTDSDQEIMTEREREVWAELIGGDDY